MNWLCGMQRSIVTDIAGTTRDVITEQVKIGDFTLLLSDTAGLRETDNAIESIGISQAYQALDTADFVIYVVDAAVGMMQEDTEILASCKGRPVLVLWNKTDLTESQPPELDVPVLTISALHAESLLPLENQIRLIFQGSVFTDQPSIMNDRQNALIRRAADCVSVCCELLEQDAELDMIYAELEDAAHALREIEGDDVTEDVVEGVFSKFCVGK
jgi:tRNA modification GTPase